MTTSTCKLLAAVLATAAMSGCADAPPFASVPARSGTHPKATAVVDRERDAANRPKERKGEREDAAKDGGLREGIRLYNDGDFNGAIKRLSAREMGGAPLAARVSALKYTAFSYCVTARPVECRQAFDKALRLDPDFDLAPGERGHPLWGPVFAKARQAADTP